MKQNYSVKIKHWWAITTNARNWSLYYSYPIKLCVYFYPFIKLSNKFPRKLSYRLISPSKADIGQISKPILDKTDKANAWRTSVNQ